MGILFSRSLFRSRSSKRGAALELDQAPGVVDLTGVRGRYLALRVTARGGSSLHAELVAYATPDGRPSRWARLVEVLRRYVRRLV